MGLADRSRHQSDATALGRNRREGSEDFERDLRGLSQKYRSRATASVRNPSARSERFPRVSSEEAAIRQSRPELTGGLELVSLFDWS